MRRQPEHNLDVSEAVPKWAADLPNPEAMFQRIEGLLDEGYSPDDILLTLDIPPSKRASLYRHQIRTNLGRRIRESGRVQLRLVGELAKHSEAIAKGVSGLASMMCNEAISPKHRVHALSEIRRLIETLHTLAREDASLALESERTDATAEQFLQQLREHWPQAVPCVSRDNGHSEHHNLPAPVPETGD